ncbi:proteasome 26S subunit [Capsaspora owczarzaki ATCC 30864]|uniref:Proteasome 26S subunit n=1 Tax=Capsaspora owczarzaki (strain ATCC 30864) TaxID=595528 RepID=A0A0D2X389_CAPO3|nr:proteasome 26S subunit [Capsaspora owczarzaki ATCC 30864]KJE93889.1 proteasome 26S subunit [Capsaspora owczarzaki ATCC 30864]|eukprot:XP_004347354.2 proteasome 26S subunit [Capsaspora owczarzaki ATCC 30864]
MPPAAEKKDDAANAIATPAGSGSGSGSDGTNNASSSSSSSSAPTSAPAATPEQAAVADIRYQIALLDRGVTAKETRYATRVLRAISRLRHTLNKKILVTALNHFLPTASETKALLLEALALVPGDAEPMDLDSGAVTVAAEESAAAAVAATAASSTATPMDTTAAAPASTSTTTTSATTTTTAPATKAKKPAGPPASVNPEVDAYLQLLVVIFLLDSKVYGPARELAAALLAKLQQHSRRSLDQIEAKAYFYFMRAHDLSGNETDVRPMLHAALRTATLHRDDEGQATLINLLVRNYLEHGLYEQADKLIVKSTFPDHASNNEWARYFYYLGRIRATQLEYSEAFQHLQQALRKAPQTSAPGFLQTVNKLAVIVQLLLGEIPERALFRQPILRRSLEPYLLLSKAVRDGNLTEFGSVVDTHADKFKADGNYMLILRLRHSVIKTGVRMINLSYSRISTADIAEKLQLPSALDAEFIVAKAIRDGVIEASIDRTNGVMQSSELLDVYNTSEPLEAFNQRIGFCLNIHNECVKALRFPPNAHRKALETAEERRDREQQEKEFAEEMAAEED